MSTIEWRPTLDELEAEVAPLLAWDPVNMTARRAAFCISPKLRQVFSYINFDGSMTMDVWSRRAVEIVVDGRIKGHALVHFFRDPAVINAITTIMDGIDEVWDGSNMVGVINADAAKAIRSLSSWAGDLPEDMFVTVYSPEEYLWNWSPAESGTYFGASDEIIAREAQELVSEAEQDEIVVWGGVDAVARYISTRLWEEFRQHE